LQIHTTRTMFILGSMESAVLFVLIELFSLGVMVKALLANIEYTNAKC